MRSKPRFTSSEEPVDPVQLLNGRIKAAIEPILEITRQPGLSIGVLHQERAVFEYNYGTTNLSAGKGKMPNGDTLYCIASLTKAFIAASIELLEQQGKLTWDTRVASVLPEYQRVDGDPMLEEMTLRDICSHRTGLLGLNEVIQGMDGRILFPKSQAIKIINSLPKKHVFRTAYEYNNALYELAATVIETVSGYETWGHFVDKELFKSLGMTRSTAFRDVHDTNRNIAQGYEALNDGGLSEVSPTELSATSMNGASGGIRSSISDLLKWSQALLQSCDLNSEGSASASPISPSPSFFDRSTISNPASAQDGDYCTGWCYHQTPSKLGLISPNRELRSPTIGVSSEFILLYGHQVTYLVTLALCIWSRRRARQS